jgi:DNA repair protein RAD5
MEEETNVSSKFYIGEFLVDGAFSLVSGKNAIITGERVTLSRDSQEDRSKAAPAKKDSKAKGKQTTLTGFIAQPAKASKFTKKADHIIRFLSQRGFQLGRLPVATAEFVGVLMDNELAQFAGNVVEAPQVIRVGDSVLLSLRVYLNAPAFNEVVEMDEPITMLREGSETLAEKTLRERKSSLLKLFDMVGLKPRVAAPNLNLDELKEETSEKKQISKGKKAIKVETIGEGEDAEEVEVEDDGEDLDERDIDTIYQK